jgi:hypothetical protein
MLTVSLGAFYTVKISSKSDESCGLQARTSVVITEKKNWHGGAKFPNSKFLNFMANTPTVKISWKWDKNVVYVGIYWSETRKNERIMTNTFSPLQRWSQHIWTSECTGLLTQDMPESSWNPKIWTFWDLPEIAYLIHGHWGHPLKSSWGHGQTGPLDPPELPHNIICIHT